MLSDIVENRTRNWYETHLRASRKILSNAIQLHSLCQNESQSRQQSLHFSTRKLTITGHWIDMNTKVNFITPMLMCKCVKLNILLSIHDFSLRWTHETNDLSVLSSRCPLAESHVWTLTHNGMQSITNGIQKRRKRTLTII